MIQNVRAIGRARTSPLMTRVFTESMMTPRAPGAGGGEDEEDAIGFLWGLLGLRLAPRLFKRAGRSPGS